MQRSATLAAGSALPALALAAQLSEALRAKAAPFDKLAWDLDSKAALIRRHANGNNPEPNGTAAEHADLDMAIAKASEALGSTKHEIMLSGAFVAVLDEAAALITRFINIAEAVESGGRSGEPVVIDQAELDSLKKATFAFGMKGMLTRKVLGGSEAVRRAQTVGLEEFGDRETARDVIRQAFGRLAADPFTGTTAHD